MKKSITPFELKKILSKYNEFTLTCFDQTNHIDMNCVCYSAYACLGAAPKITFSNRNAGITIHNYSSVCFEESQNAAVISLQCFLVIRDHSIRVQIQIDCRIS